MIQKEVLIAMAQNGGAEAVKAILEMVKKDEEQAQAARNEQLVAIRHELAGMIKERTGKDCGESDVLKNVHVLASEYKDETDESGYAVKVLPPAIANKAWQLMTGGRGTVKTASKFNQDAGTVTILASLTDGDRTISKQCETPVNCSNPADIQRTVSLRTGKLLAECYRLAGVGYYPDPKADKAVEMDPVVTGQVAPEKNKKGGSPAAVAPSSAPATPAVTAAPAAAQMPTQKSQTTRKAYKAEAAGTGNTDSAVRADANATRRSASKDKAPAASAPQKQTAPAVTEPGNAASNTAEGTTPAAEAPAKVLDYKITVPAGSYPTVEEALKTRASLVRAAVKTYGDLVDLANALPYSYAKLSSRGKEADDSPIGAELRALRVLIAAHPECWENDRIRDLREPLKAKETPAA